MSKPESSSDFRIFSRGLADYKANPVLLIPALISNLSAALLLVITELPLKMRTAQLITSPDFATPIDLITFLAEVLVLAGLAVFVGFVCTVGLAAMSARVVTSGKCVLSDWTGGIRKYFLRILGLATIFAILATIIVAPVTMAVAPVTIALWGQIAVFGLWLLVSLLSSLIGLVTYVCYAAATIDNASVQASISTGFSVIRKARGRFFVLLVVFYAVAAIQLLLGVPAPLSMNSELVLTNSNFGVYTGVLRAVVSAILLPFWFLATFELFREISQANRGATIPS